MSIATEFESIAVTGFKLENQLIVMADYDCEIRHFTNGYFWSWDGWLTCYGPFKNAQLAFLDWDQC